MRADWLKSSRAITANCSGLRYEVPWLASCCRRQIEALKTRMASAGGEVPLPSQLQIPAEGFPKYPKYKTLLLLKEVADGTDYWQKHPDVPCSGPSELLCTWITRLFPAVLVSRPGRIVERLQLPTVGKKCLKGSQLESYLQKTWIPPKTGNSKNKGTDFHSICQT